MQIKVIGSGNIESKSHSSCFLIDKNILIDMPNGTKKVLANAQIDANKIENVLITHFHGDHFFDIPFYLLGKIKASSNKVTFYVNFKGIKKIKKLVKLAFPNTVKRINNNVKITYNINNSFQINNYLVTKMIVKHGKLKGAYGYLFKFKDKLVGFTGDATYDQNIINTFSKCDYLFCDCSLIKGNEKHMGIDNILEICKLNKNICLYPTHMADEVKQRLINLNNKQIKVINDGDTISI